MTKPFIVTLSSKALMFLCIIFVFSPIQTLGGMLILLASSCWCFWYLTVLICCLSCFCNRKPTTSIVRILIRHGNDKQIIIIIIFSIITTTIIFVANSDRVEEFIREKEKQIVLHLIKEKMSFFNLDKV